jgi:hypothetical protein
MVGLYKLPLYDLQQLLILRQVFFAHLFSFVFCVLFVFVLCLLFNIACVSKLLTVRLLKQTKFRVQIK